MLLPTNKLLKVSILLFLGLVAGSYWLQRQRPSDESALKIRDLQIDQLSNQVEQLQRELAVREASANSGVEESNGFIKRLAELDQKWKQCVLEGELAHASLAALQRQVALQETNQPLPRPEQSKAANQGTRERTDVPSDGDAFEAYMCMNHLQQIGRAAARWAEAHGDRAPTSFLDLQGDVAPMIFVCPSTPQQPIFWGWREFDPAQINYRLVSPGIEWIHGGSRPFAKCPIHDTAVWNEGSIGADPPSSIPHKYHRPKPIGQNR